MQDPKALMSTQELATALGQANLRIYDCTTYLEPTPTGSEDPYIAVPGVRTFENPDELPGADEKALQVRIEKNILTIDAPRLNVILYGKQSERRKQKHAKHREKQPVFHRM